MEGPLVLHRTRAPAPARREGARAGAEIRSTASSSPGWKRRAEAGTRGRQDDAAAPGKVRLSRACRRPSMRWTPSSRTSHPKHTNTSWTA
jgi:hypothetical protein